MTPEQEAKLPKFAQTEIANLRRKLEMVQRDLEVEQNASVDPGETYISVSYGLDNHRYYPDNYRVKFKFGKHTRDEIELYVRKNALYLFGGTVINIKPTSGNAIEVRLEDF